jgi:glyceraldehyde 3-phosphate dehydrogenase
LTIRAGINGFGRMGRLGLRAVWGWPDLEIAHINEIAGDAACSAHLLEFDSVHGRWGHETAADGQDALMIDGQRIGYSRIAEPGAVDWDAADVELVIEASGGFRSLESLAPYSRAGSTSRRDSSAASGSRWPL